MQISQVLAVDNFLENSSEQIAESVVDTGSYDSLNHPVDSSTELSLASERGVADKIIHVDIETQTLNKQRPRVVDQNAALINLNDKKWGDGRVFTLDGSWDMYWNLLAVPDVIPTLDFAPEPFLVPGLWNAPKGDNPVRDRFGFATLRVHVRVPASLEPLYLRLPDMPSAYSLWINGEPMAFNGVVGFGQASERPNFSPKVIEVRNHGGLLEIVLQISNFHYKEGGVWHSLKITDASGEPYLKTWPMLFDAFIFTLLVSIALYHISVYVMRRQEKAALYFGLLCLAVGVRSLMAGQRIIYMPEVISWEWLQAGEHILFYLSLPLFLCFYKALFPAEVSKKSIFGGWFAALTFSLLTAITPVYFFTLMAFPFQIIVLIVLVYVIVSWVTVYRAKRPGARLFGSSLLIFFLAVVNDFLNANFVIQTVAIAELGLLAFVVSQVILLNRRYVHSLSITENLSATLQEHNEQLIKLDEFKDEFLATTSHELRMPLHSIYGLAHVMMNEPEIRKNDVQSNNLELIAATAQRLSTLVNDILDFSSIKHGRLDLRIETTDIRMLVSTLIDTVSPLIGSKDVALSADFEAGVQFVCADPNRLQQILFNLVGNAIKFTDEGFILIRGKRTGDEIEIDVVDTGIGIPQDRQGLVLNPFEKLEQREVHQYTGTGLGLSISKQLVELQGGKLTLESKVNIGTTVKFTLPVGEAVDIVAAASSENKGELRDEDALQLFSSRRAPVEEITSSEAASVERDEPYAEASLKSDISALDDEYALLYVVDDEEVNRQLLSRQLHSVGFVVESFSGGGAMLERLDHVVPDLIILDLMMPNLNGFQVLTRIRENYNAYELPVVMLTARHQSSDIIRALNLGANDYLCKPYHDKELVARASSLLSVRRLWRVREENDRLQAEIQRRLLAEDNLKSANQRLLTVLNHTEEPICLLDPSLALLYANPCMVSFFGQKSVSDLDEMEAYFDEKTCQLLKDFANEGTDSVQQMAIELSVNKKMKTANLTGRCFEDADHRYIALALMPAEQSGDKALNIISDISTELTASRGRIDALENALQSVTQLLNPQEATSEDTQPSVLSEPSVEPILEPSSVTLDSLQSPNHLELSREKLVDLLRVSMNYWERYSGKGKTELAEESKCWRVYLDGGTVKTRTLDKYLSIKTLPENPRWRSVIRTANFVMAKCTMNEDDQQSLSALIREVEERFS